MRLPRLSFLRALTGLAMAIASPAVEVGHGLAHEHEDQHVNEVSHHDEALAPMPEHSTGHPHERVSEALRNRVDVGEFVVLPAMQIGVDPPVVPVSFPIPFSDARSYGDRATGPPPSLRAPPLA